MAYVRPEDIGKPSDDNGWLEPESPANVDGQPEYPYNNITQTQSGHTFEMDDTPGRERIRLQHRSGTFIEMHPDGVEVHKVFGDGYEITTKNKNVLIEGNCNLTINGNCIVHIKGDKIERIEGNYEQEIYGDYNQVIKGKAKILSEDNMSIGANPNLAGSLRLSTGDSTYFTSDVYVGGDFTASKITSRSSVDATTGVGAGPQGFVSESGGLSIGVPIAVPGQILCVGAIGYADPLTNTYSPPVPIGTLWVSGTITAGISVNAPFASFGVMDAILMTDLVNTSIYNTHIHPSYKGPTGTPITTMF